MIVMTVPIWKTMMLDCIHAGNISDELKDFILECVLHAVEDGEMSEAIMNELEDIERTFLSNLNGEV